MNAIVEESRRSSETGSASHEGDLVLGPPIVQEELDVRDKGARWSPAFAWSGQTASRWDSTSPPSRRTIFPTSSIDVQSRALNSEPELTRKASSESVDRRIPLSRFPSSHSVPSLPWIRPEPSSSLGDRDPPSPGTRSDVNLPLLPLFPLIPAPPTPPSPGPSTPRRPAASISPQPSPTSSRSATPTPAPHRQIRSKVSLDAVATPRPISTISNASTFSNRSSSPISPTYELPSPIFRRTDRPRFARTPSPVRFEPSPSSTIIDEGEERLRRNKPIDGALRSQLGVIGLGEGWAGGPQGKSKRRWFKRRRTEEATDEDPLSLWTIVDGNEAISPLKAIWNRSKQRLFGASSVMLTETWQMRKAWFSRSRVNLTGAHKEKSKKPKRQGLATSFTRSQGDKQSSPSSRGMLSPPGLLPSSGNTTHEGSLRDVHARSEPRRIPSRIASLRKRPSTPNPGRLPPPRRSHAGSSQIPQILELEERRDTTAHGTPVTDLTSGSITRLDGRARLEVTRTTTFGPLDFAAEQTEGNELLADLDTLQAWAEEGQETEMSIPKLRPSLSGRRQSVLLRLRKALSPSPTRSSTRLIAPPSMRIFRRGSSRPSAQSAPPSYVNSSGPEVSEVREDVRHVLETSSARPARLDRQKTKRRGSWMDNLSNEPSMDHLSRLTEADEAGATDNRRNSFERALRVRSSSSLSLGPERERTRLRIPTSMSMPALHNSTFSASRLSLCLDDTRRRSIISTLSTLSTLDTEASPDASQSSQMEVLGTLPGPSGHSRGAFVPVDPIYQLHQWHRRSHSVPDDISPRLEEQVTHSETSTLNPVTPVLPSLFQAQCQLRSRPTLNSDYSMPSFRTNASFNTAEDELEFDCEPTLSMTDESMVTRAVRVAAPGEIGTKASYISLPGLRASFG